MAGTFAWCAACLESVSIPPEALTAAVPPGWETVDLITLRPATIYTPPEHYVLVCPKHGVMT